MSEHKATPKPEEAKKVTSELGSNETATSFEGASYDFGPGVMAFKSLQAAADDSPRSNNITQLQAMADDHVENDSNGILQLQAMADARATTLTEPIQRQENKTGLPDNLKSGMENLSGYSMDDVKVHRNSAKPAQLQAHAYAQGTDIHLGPGQEKHLPHELGHVVQQKQGRVKPTTQLKGKVNINDDAGLEKEADVLGAKALQFKGSGVITPKKATVSQGSVQKVAQLNGKWSILKAFITKKTVPQKERDKIIHEAFASMKEKARKQEQKKTAELFSELPLQDEEKKPTNRHVNPDQASSEDMYGDALSDANIKFKHVTLDELKFEILPRKKTKTLIEQLFDLISSEKAEAYADNIGGVGGETNALGAAALLNGAVGGEGQVQIDSDGQGTHMGKAGDGGSDQAEIQSNVTSNAKIGKLENNNDKTVEAALSGTGVVDANFSALGSTATLLPNLIRWVREEYNDKELTKEKGKVQVQIDLIKTEAVKNGKELSADETKLISDYTKEIDDLDIKVEESKISVYEKRIETISKSARLSAWLLNPPVAAAIAAIENLMTVSKNSEMIFKLRALGGDVDQIINQLSRGVAKNTVMAAANASTALAPVTAGGSAPVAAALGGATAAWNFGSFVLKKYTGQLGAVRGSIADDIITKLSSKDKKDQESAREVVKILKVDVYKDPVSFALKDNAKQLIADCLKSGSNVDLFSDALESVLKTDLDQLFDQIPSLKGT